MTTALDLRAKAQVVCQTPADMQSVPSPCISVCNMDEGSGYCNGCWRTLDEIAAWSCMEDEGKRRIWVRIGERLDAAGVSG